MKILFIGGTGNISTACVKLAMAHGNEVTLLNRGISASGIPGANNITADIHDEEQVKTALKGHQFDAVANFIAFTPDDVERDIRLFSGKISQYFFISSATVYEKPPPQPFITEETPLSNPFWEYARNKIACEQKLNQAYAENGFPAVIIRPSLTYDTVIPLIFGAWKEYTLIDRMKRGGKIIVHGDGTSLWSITHSKDFAKGFVGLAGNHSANGEAFHITTDELLTWNQIYHYTAEAAGVTPKIVHISSDFIAAHSPGQLGGLLGDKAHSVIFDNSKIKRFAPGFKATIPFSEGIRETLSWFESDAFRMTINPASNQLMDRIIKAYERGLPD